MSNFGLEDWRFNSFWGIFFKTSRSKLIGRLSTLGVEGYKFKSYFLDEKHD